MDDVDCRTLVELVTDYLAGALDPGTDDAVTRHLPRCPPCREYLAQLRATIAATGRVRGDSLDVRTRAELVDVFRHLVRGRRS